MHIFGVQGHFVDILTGLCKTFVKRYESAIFSPLFQRFTYKFPQNAIHSFLGVIVCNKYLFSAASQFVVIVVELLFYVHGKHLRSCPDGQLI